MRFKNFIDPTVLSNTENEPVSSSDESTSTDDIIEESFQLSEDTMQKIRDYFIEHHVKVNNPHAYRKIMKGE